MRSLWAALRSSWFVGVLVLVGWLVGLLVVCWPVSWEVVVAVDIGTCDLLEGWMEGPAAKTADRPVAARARKTPLAGDDSGGLRRAISHRGDYGAVCHREPESGGENPGRALTHSAAGFYRAEGWGREGYPISR